MKVHFIEASQSLGPPYGNWGKFMVAQFDSEWEYRSVFYPDQVLLESIGWRSSNFLWVVDLQTGEGAFFKHGGHAQADLRKHQIWVCPLFEPFLQWLYTQDITDITSLPSVVELPDAEFEYRGYRRPGPHSEEPTGNYPHSPSEIDAGDYYSLSVAPGSKYVCKCGVLVKTLKQSVEHLFSAHGIHKSVAHVAIIKWKTERIQKNVRAVSTHNQR